MEEIRFVFFWKIKRYICTHNVHDIPPMLTLIPTTLVAKSQWKQFWGETTMANVNYTKDFMAMLTLLPFSNWYM